MILERLVYSFCRGLSISMYYCIDILMDIDCHYDADLLSGQASLLDVSVFMKDRRISHICLIDPYPVPEPYLILIFIDCCEYLMAP
jgi:hypothetical protein